jgi:hypothetical protein
MKELLTHLEALRDNAYFEYIGHCRRDECLGWEAKIDYQKFGLPEIEAHKRAAEWLGKHRAYANAVKCVESAICELKLSKKD